MNKKTLQKIDLIFDKIVANFYFNSILMVIVASSMGSLFLFGSSNKYYFIVFILLPIINIVLMKSRNRLIAETAGFFAIVMFCGFIFFAISLLMFWSVISRSL